MKLNTKLILFGLLVLLPGCADRQSVSPVEEETYSTAELSTDKIHYGPDSPNYKIDVLYSKQEHQLTGKLEVTFKNNLHQKLDEVYFNLWPNAEMDENSWIDVESVSTDTKQLPFSVEGTALKIHGLSIEENEEATIEMDFTVQIPHQKGRFGWTSKQVSLGNWFPILAVYDDHGWNLHSYFEEGESFYSVTGSYEVTFEVPSDTKVIATGKLIDTNRSASTSLYRFEASDVRDFAGLFHTDLQTIQKASNDVLVRVHYREEEAEKAARMLEAAVHALETYHHTIGPYLWDTLDIASVDFGSSFNGGMEYPQLVFINAPYLSSEEDLEGTVMHEVGHQWFYSAVGNDSYREPWLDESLTTYISSTALYGTIELDWELTETCEFPLTSTVADFMPDKQDCYEEVIYVAGAEMLDRLERELGKEVFQKGMKQYYQSFQFKIATTADFIRVMEEVSGRNLYPFFSAYGIELK